MRVGDNLFPQSGFLSVEKDLNLLIQKILKNERLKKLLFYADKNCLSLPNLTEEETLSLINNQIKIVPKLSIDGDILTYIIITYDNFTQSENPEFRDNILTFDIICHFDQWNLGDFKLRPYVIAGELDAMFNKQHLTGIGELQFAGANQLILNEEFAGLTVMYTAVHGKEDRVE